MAIAVVLVLLVVGSIIFHFASPWWFTDIATNWGNIDLTISITFWVTGFVFIAINLFMAWCVYRYRQSKDHTHATYEPESTRLEWGLTTFTTVGVIAMLAPGLFVWAELVNVPEETQRFEVMGSQWQWAFRYPGEDGQLGTADIEHINERNPWGINPEDPAGQDDVVVKQPTMYLPVDTPVQALLRSRDVLHNYTVPQFRVKMDMVPGMVSYMWFEPTRTGEFEVLCEQYCGLGHHIMRARVRVTGQDEFDNWLAEQPTFAETQEQPEADLASGEQQYTACASCHGQDGGGNQAMNAPRLAGLQSWYIDRQLRYYQEGIRGAHEDDQFGQTMAPMAGTVSSESARRNVSAYIEENLSAEPADVTIEQGDPDNGQRIYEANCASCHDDDGTGNWSTDAPSLVGLDDWYIIRQINNYKEGIRGEHPDDDYGYQMSSMVSAMRNEQQVNDVVSYINSLR